MRIFLLFIRLEKVRIYEELNSSSLDLTNYLFPTLCHLRKRLCNV